MSSLQRISPPQELHRADCRLAPWPEPVLDVCLHRRPSSSFGNRSPRLGPRSSGSGTRTARASAHVSRDRLSRLGLGRSLPEFDLALKYFDVTAVLSECSGSLRRAHADPLRVVLIVGNDPPRKAERVAHLHPES